MLIGTDRENYSNTAGNFDIIKKPFWKREHAFNQRAFIVHYKCLKASFIIASWPKFNNTIKSCVTIYLLPASFVLISLM